MTDIKNFCLDIPKDQFKNFELELPYYCLLPIDVDLKKGDVVVWNCHGLDGHAKVLYSAEKNGKLVCTFKKIS